MNRGREDVEGVRNGMENMWLGGQGRCVDLVKGVITWCTWDKVRIRARAIGRSRPQAVPGVGLFSSSNRKKLSFVYFSTNFFLAD